MSELKKMNPGKENEIDQWLKSRGYDEQTAKFQPIKITAARFAAFVDANTAKVIGISTFKA